MRSALSFLVCDEVITCNKFHFICTCISRVDSCVFHIHLGHSFLDLELQKWPISAFHNVAMVVFFFDRDCVIVDHELQGSIHMSFSQARH